MNADERVGNMTTFRVFRRNPPEHYVPSGFANKPDEVQFEGVIFSDGTVSVRWMTEHRSVSFWASWEELMAVHGHPEYDTVIEQVEVSKVLENMTTAEKFLGAGLTDVMHGLHETKWNEVERFLRRNEPVDTKEPSA